MVKPLTFKGDKKPKKRKRAVNDDDTGREVKAAKPSADTVDVEPEADDSWVSADVPSDISGPVMLVLPTEPPSALACDANGKVFTIVIENIIDGNPSSAEPHDVRQVWVANKIPGTEHFRLKGHHGKYLSCDKIGVLSATADAVSPLETWDIISTPSTPGTFQLQTQRDTFVTVRETPNSKKQQYEVRGDETDVTFHTTLRIRMQARFKPRVQKSKEEKALKERVISRRELEEAAGRKLTDEEVKMLRRARKEGDYHEKLLDIKVKSKHDKFG